MIRVLLLGFGVLIFSSTAQAQEVLHPACKTEGQTKVFGCLDRVNWDDRNIVYPEATNFLFGWSLVCSTGQQASHVQVWVSGDYGATLLSADQFAVAWRGWRPDVYHEYRWRCDLTGPYWGYAIAIFPHAIPAATQRISVRFFEPSQGVGVNDQERTVTVRSITR